MSDYCSFNIYGAFEGVTKEVKKEIIEGINELREIHKEDPTKFTEKSAEFVKEFNARNVVMTEMEINSIIVGQSFIDYIDHPDFGGDIEQAVQSKFFIGRSNTPNSGGNIETNRKINTDRFIHAFHDHLASKNIFEIAKTGTHGKDAFVAITKGTVESLEDPISRELARTIKHFSDMQHAAYNNAYIPIKYRQDFVVNRVMSPEKVGAVPFNEWSAELLASLNAKESYKYLEPKHIQEVLGKLSRGEGIDSLLGGKGKDRNQLAERLWETYNRGQKDFDPFTQEENPWFLKDFSKERESAAQKRTYGRKWVFASPEGEYDFLMKYSPYDNLVEAYMGGAKRAAREIAIFKELGPYPKRTLDNIKSFAGQKMEGGKLTDFVADIDRYFHVVSSGSSAPTKMLPKLLHNVVLPLSSANMLGRALLSNLQDPFVQFNHAFIKGQRDFVSTIIDVGHNRLKAMVDAHGEDAGKYMLIAEDARNQVFEGMLADPTALPSKLAELINIVGLTKFFNKQTWVSSYHSALSILQDSAASNRISDLQTRLYAKYGLDHKDLSFMNKHLSVMESPRELMHIPESSFENNPRGITAKGYKNMMSEKVYAFMYEYITRASSSPGLRERSYRNLGQADPDSILSVIGNAGLQFKSVGLKIMLENINLLGLASGKESKSAIFRDPKTYTYAALIGATSVTSYLLSDTLRRLSYGETPDEIKDFYTDSSGEAIGNLLYRSNTIAFFGDYMNKTARPEDIASAAVTPALKTLSRPVLAASGLVKGEPKEAAAELMKGLFSLAPGQNLLWLGPLSKDYKEFQNKIIENIKD